MCASVGCPSVYNVRVYVRMYVCVCMCEGICMCAYVNRHV